MFWVLLLLFVALPLAELALLVQLGSTLGWPTTLLIALVTGVLGAALARAQGVATLARITRQLAGGHPPADALVDGAMILLAGAVLVTPGVLTDAFGFALLAPPVRAALKPLLRAAFARAVKRGVANGSVRVWATRGGPAAPTATRGGDVIDVEVTEVRTSEPREIE